MSSSFRIENQEFIAFNGGPYSKMTPAISFFVSCKSQKEIDYFWKALSKGGKTLQCGWLTDKFGVTWHIIPECLEELIGDPDEKKASRAMSAMMKMKKIEITQLKEAHSGRRRPVQSKGRSGRSSAN